MVVSHIVELSWRGCWNRTSQGRRIQQRYFLVRLRHEIAHPAIIIGEVRRLVLTPGDHYCYATAEYVREFTWNVSLITSPDGASAAGLKELRPEEGLDLANFKAALGALHDDGAAIDFDAEGGWRFVASDSGKKRPKNRKST